MVLFRGRLMSNLSRAVPVITIIGGNYYKANMFVLLRHFLGYFCRSKIFPKFFFKANRSNPSSSKHQSTEFTLANTAFIHPL